MEAGVKAHKKEKQFQHHQNWKFLTFITHPSFSADKDNDDADDKEEEYHGDCDPRKYDKGIVRYISDPTTYWFKKQNMLVTACLHSNPVSQGLKKRT